MTITSPIDGVVTRLNAKVGELVVTGTMNNPGTVIMEVADLSQMLVVAQVDEADIGKLKVVHPSEVDIGDPNNYYEHNTIPGVFSKSNFNCMEIVDGRVKIKFEGLGDKVEVSQMPLY